MSNFVVPNPLILILVFLCGLCVSDEHSEWVVNIYSNFECLIVNYGF